MPIEIVILIFQILMMKEYEIHAERRRKKETWNKREDRWVGLIPRLFELLVQVVTPIRRRVERRILPRKESIRRG